MKNIKKNTDHYRYIIICLTVMLLLIGFNSFFFIMKDAFGYGTGTFLFSSEDRFADIIKTSLSYRDVLLKIPNLKHSIDNLSPIYQYYFYDNPYKGIAGIEGLTHFHMTPISSLLNIIVAVAIGYGKTPNTIMFTLFFLCILLAFISTYNIVRCYKKSLLLVALIMVSYPLLYIITRGNYAAFLCGIGVLAFLNSLFINKKLDFFSLFLFAVAINFRPNSIILILALTLLFGIRKSIWPAIQILLVTAAIYISTYYILNFIYPDYTITTFLKALSVYFKLYVHDSQGDAFNSSMYALLRMFSNNISVISWVFRVLAVFILLAVGRLIFKKNSISAYYPFILSSIYILLNQVAGDYHLLIFVVPIFIIFINYEKWQNDIVTMRIITISTVLILVPKNYLFVNGISMQVVIHPLILLLISAYLYYKIETKPVVNFRKLSIKHKPGAK